MAGKIIADTLEHSTAGSLDTSYVVQGSAKVYHSANDAGTVLNGSLNVSSLTDTSSGQQTVNLSASTADTNYSVIAGSGNKDSGNARVMLIQGVTSSSYVSSAYSTFSSTFSDTPQCSILQGNLA
jgi:hypothetical protein